MCNMTIKCVHSTVSYHTINITTKRLIANNALITCLVKYRGKCMCFSRNLHLTKYNCVVKPSTVLVSF